MIGYNPRLTASNINVKNVTINCVGGNYIGGVVAATNVQLNNVYVYGINIETTASYYVGGIIGYGSGVSNGHIEGHTEGGIYNRIYAPQTTRVGGVSGYTWSGIPNASAKNLEITGNGYVGGLIGWIITSSNTESGISQDNIITGNSHVGGILGALTPDSTKRANVLNINNSYTNSTVIANNKNAGGIIGHLDNSKMNNQTYVSKIWNNYVACSEISAPENAGGLIGKLEKPIYYVNDNTKYYYGNLVVSNISENYPIGNIDNLYETYTQINTIIDEETGEEITEEVIVTKKVDPEVTKARLFNSLFYRYTIEGENKVLEKSKLDNLKSGNAYNEIGFNTAYYDYTDIDTMFPKFKKVINKNIEFNDGTSHLFNQSGIMLPGEATNVLLLNNSGFFSMNAYLKETLPEYVIYVSDVDKINVEFNKINSNTYFKYENIENGVSEKISIKERTYTFEYDFNSDFKIIVGNSDEEKETIFAPEDIRKKVSTVNGNYYYLEGSTLKVSLDTIEGTFVNLFNNKALTDKGNIYNLAEDTLSKEKITGLKLLSESTPIAKDIYSTTIIEAYYNYSKLIGEQETTIDYQTFIKNGTIFVLDGNLDIYADSIIIDAYNNKQYQTVLGEDGILYDLKDEINYPKNFENKDILQMTNNINIDRNEILIFYESGRVYAFNYITGSVLFDSNNQDENKESIISNIGSLFEKNDTLYELSKEEYEEAVLLQEKLTDTPIEVAQELLNQQTGTSDNELGDSTNVDKNNIDSSDTNQSSNNESNNITSNTEDNSYTTVYDADSNQYLVYKISNLLDTNKKDDEEVVSETEKIYSISGLKEYYNVAKADKYFENINGIYFIAIIIGAILAILAVMYKKKNYQ